MRILFFTLAVLISVAVCGTWVVLGANTGWTHTEKVITQIDPITEIPYPTRTKAFEPGLDFLVAGELVSSALLIAAFFLPKSKKQSPIPTT